MDTRPDQTACLPGRREMGRKYIDNFLFNYQDDYLCRAGKQQREAETLSVSPWDLLHIWIV